MGAEHAQNTCKALLKGARMWAQPLYYHKVFKTDRFRYDSVMVLNSYTSRSSEWSPLGAKWFKMRPKLFIWSTCIWAALGSKWIRKDPKWYQNEPFGASGRPWSKIERNGTETAHLEHLGGLGPKMIQNGTEVPRERGRKLSKVAWGRELRRGLWEVCLNAQRLVIVSMLT